MVQQFNILVVLLVTVLLVGWRIFRKKGSCIFIVLAMMTVSSCVNFSTNDSVNSWIYKQMKTHYLYNSSIPSSVNMSQSPDNFFVSMLSDKEKRNSGSFFSRIEETGGGTKSSFDKEDWYGMEVKFLLDPHNNMLLAVVEYVQKNTPAERSGLKRGDIIYKINGTMLSLATAKQLFYGGERRLTRGYATEDHKVEFRDEIKLQAAESLYEHPIQMAKVIEINGSKVGYMVYVAFSTGSGGFEDKEYEKEFISTIQGMKNQGIDDFVLDLRFNPGGYVDECAIVASCFVPSDKLGTLFAYTKTNSKLNQRNDKYFSTDEAVKRANLNLSRMAVITSTSTASASELLIHGLRPYCEIIQVGNTTEGKNVGSYELSDKKYSWVMNPITVQIYNSLNSSSFEKGFKPTTENLIEEERYVSIMPLGDVNEVLLNRALTELGYNSPLRARTCINEEKSVSLQPIKFSKTRFGGSIETIVPEDF